MSSFDCWEYDYIREIFPESDYKHISKRDFEVTSNNSSKELFPKVIVYNVENSGSDGKYSIIREYIVRYKPIILVHLSDEFQGWAKKWKYGEGVEVYNLVRLAFKKKHSTKQ
jgi:hypothetical protein